MSIDTVDGGKVWTPPEPEDPNTIWSATPTFEPYAPSRKAKFLTSLGIMFTSCFVVTFIASLVHLSLASEEEFALAESIANYTENDKSFILSHFMIFIVFALIAVGAFVISYFIDYIAELSLKLKLVSVISGIIMGVGMIFWTNATVADTSDQTAIVDEWMQETYGYELVEVLPVNKYSEKNGLLADGKEKFVVKDLVTGEEKTVYYYDREENFYLAETDSEFLKQFQNDRENVSGESK